MVRIEVRGQAAPQGSKSFRGYKKGKAILVEASPYLKPWRDTVVWACLEQARDVRLRGPVAVEVVFTRAKPVGAPKTRRTWPDRSPDIDKLVRAIFDSLVTAGLIEDDGRVVTLIARKVYPNEDPDALSVPGAVIRIHRLTAVEPEQPVLEFRGAGAT